MKKVFSIVILFTVLVWTTASATEAPGLNERIQRSFQQDYPKASPLLYKRFSDLSVISFLDHDKYCIAIYNEDGAKEGEGRYITSDEMPMMVARQLQAAFGDYRIHEIMEFTPAGDGLSYFASIETANKKIVARIYGSGYVEVLRKEKKKTE